MRIAEILEQFKDGLITESQAIHLCLSACLASSSRYSDDFEDRVLELTGKRPHEIMA
jgi:hypothetical protein